MKNAGIGLQKVQLLECKIFKYKPLKMDAEKKTNCSPQNSENAGITL